MLTLNDAHFQVYGVAHDIDLCGMQLVKEVTIVPVVVAHGILIVYKSLVEQLLVVNISFLHAQHTVQVVCGIYGVAHPSDVAQEIFLAFIYLDVYIDMFLVVVRDAVIYDACVAET